MSRFAAPRTALLPAFQESAAADLSRVLAEGGPSLEALILKQQLGPLWHARTQATAFADTRVQAAMLYMRQLAALSEVDQLFARVGIEYAIFKGVATREFLYDDPSVRVCCDIDILVAPNQRVEAARALVGAGYRLKLDPSVVSHEVVLARDLVAIDLHWGLLRPGRTPASMTAQMLAQRQRHADRWVLDEADALFVLLVHPVFSKHLSTSQMGLHRVADIVSWLQRRDVNWDRLHDQLDRCGLKTAAWTMLNLVRMLSPATFGATVDEPIRSLRPSPVRAAYLTSWLKQDLSARLTHFHVARLLGFSVLLHDHPADAWRAFKGWQRSRTTRETDAMVFSELSA